MIQTQEEQTDEIKELTKELDQNVRTLERLLSENKEQEDKENEDPEALLNQLEEN